MTGPMKFHLRNIQQQCNASQCKQPATTELRDHRNTTYGYYCGPCGRLTRDARNERFERLRDKGIENLRKGGETP